MLHVEERRAIVEKCQRMGWTMDLRLEFLALARMDYPFEFVIGIDKDYKPSYVSAIFGPLVSVPFKERNQIYYLFEDESARDALSDYIDKGNNALDLKLLALKHAKDFMEGNNKIN